MFDKKPNPDLSFRLESVEHNIAVTKWVKTMSVNTLPSIQYSLDVIQEEARELVQKGVISRQQPIYTLCQYIPAREWVCVEYELEKCDFLLRDRIGDLIGREEWDND